MNPKWRASSANGQKDGQNRPIRYLPPGTALLPARHSRLDGENDARRPIPLSKRTQRVSFQGVLRTPIEDQGREQYRVFERAQGVLVSLARS